MKRFLIAGAAAFGTTIALAQAPGPEPIKPKCEEPGPYPGRAGMQNDQKRNTFLKALETYKTCMTSFVEERKSVIKQNETAARAAIEEFNARMRKLNEEQEKAKEEK
jgi:hypothetical protein